MRSCGIETGPPALPNHTRLTCFDEERAAVHKQTVFAKVLFKCALARRRSIYSQLATWTFSQLDARRLCAIGQGEN